MTSAVGSRWAAASSAAVRPLVCSSDPGPGLHPGLHLHLPLVGHRVRPSLDRAQQRLGRRLRRQHLAVGPVVGEAVAALGGADERAARAHHGGAGGQALHALVEVLVEGEAGVGGDDDVERMRAPGPWPAPSRGPAGGRVLGQEVAGEHLDDAVSPVEEDVDGEVDAGLLGDLADGVVHRVADGDPPGGSGVADAAGVVQGQHRLESGQARARPAWARR